MKKKITKKVYNNIIKSIKKMDIIFMNAKTSKTSEPHVLILTFTHQLDLRRGENRIA